MGRGCGKTRRGRGRLTTPGRALAACLERADDLALERAALFFAPAITFGIGDLATEAGLGRLLPLTALGVLARADFACFLAFPFETLFFRAAMDRLKTVNEARKANETPSPRQAHRMQRLIRSMHGDHEFANSLRAARSAVFDLKMRTG